MTPVIIGVAGGTGSGKTTVVREMVRAVGREHVAVIEHDSYYRDRSELPLEVPSYDFSQHTRTEVTRTVKPMHEEFVEPSKRFADLMIPEGGHNRVAVDLLLAKIRSVIE